MSLTWMTGWPAHRPVFGSGYWPVVLDVVQKLLTMSSDRFLSVPVALTRPWNLTAMPPFPFIWPVLLFGLVSEKHCSQFWPYTFPLDIFSSYLWFSYLKQDPCLLLVCITRKSTMPCIDDKQFTVMEEPSGLVCPFRDGLTHENVYLS